MEGRDEVQINDELREPSLSTPNLFFNHFTLISKLKIRNPLPSDKGRIRSALIRKVSNLL